MPVLRTLIPLHRASADLVPGDLFVASDAEAADMLSRGWVQPVAVQVSAYDLELDASTHFASMHEQAVYGTQVIPAGTNALSVMPITLPEGALVEVGPQAVWTLLWPDPTISSFSA